MMQFLIAENVASNPEGKEYALQKLGNSYDMRGAGPDKRRSSQYG